MELDEKIQFVRTTLAPMALHTYPVIASIVGVDDETSGRHVGSALRTTFRDRRAILTAAHVIAEARGRYPRFAVTAIRGGAPYELVGPPDIVDAERDIAAYFVADNYPGEGIAFWPQERVDTEGGLLATDYLFVHGFPAVWSRFSGLAGGLVNRSLPYGVMLREDELPLDMAPFQFAMDFDPDNLRGADGQAMDWLDPHGLSGSPVCRIGASGLPVDEWSPERSLLVGIVTQWRPKERLLVASRWESVLEVAGRTTPGV